MNSITEQEYRTVELDADDDAELVGLVAEGEKHWRGIARLTNRVIMKAKAKKLLLPEGEPAGVMDAYHTIAYKSGHGISTVRNWAQYERELGAFLDHHPLTVEQVKEIKQEARTRREDVVMTAMRYVQQAAKWGGHVAPPDVIRTCRRSLGKNAPSEDPFESALYRALSSLTTARKKATDEQTREWVRWLADQVEHLIETGGVDRDYIARTVASWSIRYLVDRVHGQGGVVLARTPDTFITAG